MPVVDITNPETIKFLIESYNKTTLLRVRWNNLNKERLERAATLSHEKAYPRESDITTASIRAGLAAITRDHASGAVNRKRVFFSGFETIFGISELRKGHSIVDIGLGDPKVDPRLARPDTDLRTDPKMRPVDPEHSEILYKDIPYFGRKVYLNKRDHILPEDKYYFPETSGYEYGWRHKNSSFGKPTAPKFGQVSKF